MATINKLGYKRLYAKQVFHVSCKKHLSVRIHYMKASKKSWKSVVLQKLKQLEPMVGVVSSLRCKLGGSLFWKGLRLPVSPGMTTETR